MQPHFSRWDCRLEYSDRRRVHCRFRERQLRAQEEQAGAEAPEVATIAALPGSSSQARQKQSSRSRANRCPFVTLVNPYSLTLQTL